MNPERELELSDALTLLIHRGMASIAINHEGDKAGAVVLSTEFAKAVGIVAGAAGLPVGRLSDVFREGSSRAESEVHARGGKLSVVMDVKLPTNLN
jgi:hypothetical protein